MNNLQPYEKHLAEKLQQVPVPSKDEGWKEMRKLLDRDMPEGGAGWGGNRKWWWMGLIVAIIITGVWLSQQFRANQKETSQQLIAGSISSKEDKIVNDNKDNKNEISAAESKKIDNRSNKNEPVTERETSEKILPVHNTNSSNDGSLIDSKSSIGELSSNERSDFVSDKKSNSVKNQHQSAGIALIGSGMIMQRNGRPNNSIKTQGASGHHSKSGVDQSMQDVSQNESMGDDFDQKTIISSSIRPTGINETSFPTPGEQYTQSPFAHDPIKAEPGKTDKVFAKEMRKKSVKEDTRKMNSKSMRGMSGEKVQELTFAAGLSLPQSFAIGGQQSPSYGVNAKPGIVSDYIPVPYFQYHVNNRLFVQTELQFQAPQFTDKLLVYQSQQAIAPTNGMLEKNIFIEKLYYFHIPFNVYFSPAKNFYLGSGIQFSSLLSGVATYQNNSYTNGTLQNSSSRVQGFRDDSVAAKLASSEWRYQLDANYYFKRFTVGARYNQALKQFVDLQPSSTLPFTQGRNQSFLLYLRYNIWEERKKTAYTTNNW